MTGETLTRLATRVPVQTPSAPPHPAGALGAALAGPALVRLSGALWKSQWEHLDVLGCALRFLLRIG